MQKSITLSDTLLIYALSLDILYLSLSLSLSLSLYLSHSSLSLSLSLSLSPLPSDISAWGCLCLNGTCCTPARSQTSDDLTHITSIKLKAAICVLTLDFTQRRYKCLNRLETCVWCMLESLFLQIHMWPWSTKPIISVNFFKIEINASSESWINNISIDVWFGQYL